MDHRKDSALPADPPPGRVHPGKARPRPTTATRPCRDCEGSGYTPISHDYNPTTGRLVIVGGLCVACRGEGERVVFIYRGGGS